MAVLSLPQLQRALGKTPPRGAFYLAGSEAILKDEALAALLDRALDPGLRDFNLDYLSASNLEPDELAAACSTLPMMAASNMSRGSASTTSTSRARPSLPTSNVTSPMPT